MPLSEFELIRRFFRDSAIAAHDVSCGIGDDAAVVAVPAGSELVLSMDTLVAGVHFLPDAAAEDIGYRSLAVNLSDLAAMGATPRWVTLSLTLPEPDEDWLNGFMAGFSKLAKKYETGLVGGDLTRGPLVITVQIHGLVPEGQALTRSGARPGDRVYISGCPGEAGLALRILKGELSIEKQFQPAVLSRHHRPTPRVELGVALRGIASSAIDISDGLAADLGHILEASHCGADLFLEQLPLSRPLQQLTGEEAWQLALSGGDDYELCFTVPPRKAARIDDISFPDCRLTCIGEIKAGGTQQWYSADGSEFESGQTGYRHF